MTQRQPNRTRTTMPTHLVIESYVYNYIPLILVAWVSRHTTKKASLQLENQAYSTHKVSTNKFTLHFCQEST